MDWSAIESAWEEFKASAKLRWGKLSVAQINGMVGSRDDLVRRVRAAYALTPEEAERQIAEWQAKHARKHTPSAES